MIEYFNEDCMVGMARYPDGDQPSMAQDQSIKKDEGKYRPTLVFRSLVEAVARVREYGIEKYEGDHTWHLVDPRRYLDALGRHYLAIVDGEHIDPDSGLRQLDHIACNVAFLIELEEREESLESD